MGIRERGFVFPSKHHHLDNTLGVQVPIFQDREGRSNTKERPIGRSFDLFNFHFS
jgi:hypothetical protein